MRSTGDGTCRPERGRLLQLDWDVPGGIGSTPIPGTGFALFVAGASADRGLVERRYGLVLLRQVHGGESLLDPEGGEEGDALVLTGSGRSPAVAVADCLPIAAVASSAVGMAHAGWRGLAAGIVESFVSMLPGTKTVFVLGPCICGACYEVGEEVVAAVDGEVPGRAGSGDRFRAGPFRLDLRSAAFDRLVAAGVRRDLIWSVDDCTLCSGGGSLYHSHRGSGGRAGRNLVWLSGVQLDEGRRGGAVL